MLPKRQRIRLLTASKPRASCKRCYTCCLQGPFALMMRPVMDTTGKEHDKIFYVPKLPESVPSSRPSKAGVHGSGTRALSGAELRLPNGQLCSSNTPGHQLRGALPRSGSAVHTCVGHTGAYSRFVNRSAPGADWVACHALRLAF